MSEIRFKRIPVDIYYCVDSSATGIEILIDNHNSTLLCRSLT